MIEVFCRFRFEAAHVLANLPPEHKCSRIHGHSYRVIVTVGGDVDPKLGWVVDYAVLAAVFQKRVHDVLDHQNLNEVLGTQNTTSEFLAKWIWTRFDEWLPGALDRVYLVVEVWETADFGARYNGGLDDMVPARG